MDKKKMEQKFSEWYQRVCIEATSDQLNYRFKSVYEYGDSKDVNINVLAKIFFQISCEDEGKDTFVNSIFENDKTFTSAKTQELSCLAAMTLYYLLEEKPEYENIIILTLLSMFVLKKEVIISDIIDCVIEKKEHITAKYREKGVMSLQELVSDPSKKITGTWDESTKNALLKMADDIKLLHRELQNIYQEMRIYKEDSSTLAWIVGESSNDLDKILDKSLQSKYIAIVIGKELSDFASTHLGSYSAKGFLNKMIQLCKKDEKSYSMYEIVNATSKDWRSKFIKNLKNIHITTPTILAIAKSIDLESDSDWTALYKAKSGFDANEFTKTLLEWSYQMYLECLLIKL